MSKNIDVLENGRFCIANQIPIPTIAITKVGDSDPVLNITVKMRIEDNMLS